MPQTRDRAVLTWLLTFASLAAILVVFGGFVRLTRSGLSIVEWNPVQGTFPPLSQSAWESEFAKYRRSPEYQQINTGMTLAAYREIFLIEWFHRLLARVAGLVFAVPFFIFLWQRRIPVRETPMYLVMGILFLSQAVMGWIMVSSGLVQRPSVSHVLLAAHLFLALSLIGLALWTALGHMHGFGDPQQSRTPWSAASKVALVATLGLLLQMAYGAFTAGLKAGHVSDTWPLMLGSWVPGGLMEQVQPAALNLIAAPLTVAFIHRWLAVLVLALAGVALCVTNRLQLDSSLRAALGWIAGLSVVQMGLGIAVVVSRVDIIIALLHQANALALFALSVFALHRLRGRDALAAPPQAPLGK
jgi:cytochrome c oxidase assembly protein subunit 15